MIKSLNIKYLFKNRFHKYNWIQVFALFFASIGLILLLFFSFNKAFNDRSFQISPKLASEYGEFIGGLIGSIFSLCGFLLLYATLVQQREATSKNERILIRQQYENTLFNMFNLYNEVVKNIEDNIKREHYYRDLFYFNKEKFEGRKDDNESESIDLGSGKVFLKSFYLLIKGAYKHMNDNSSSDPNENLRVRFKEHIEHYDNILSHYFRNIYHILNYIKELPDDIFEQKDKEQYFALLFSIISNKELVLVYYYFKLHYSDTFDINMLIKYVDQSDLFQNKNGEYLT